MEQHNTTTLVLDSTYGYRCTCGHEELKPRPHGGPLTIGELLEGANRHLDDLELTAMERHDRLAFGRSE